MVIKPKILTGVIRNSEKRYRTLVDNALEGVCQTNIKGDVVYANDTCLSMFAYENREEGMSVVSSLRCRARGPEMPFWRCLRRPATSPNIEVELLKKQENPWLFS